MKRFGLFVIALSALVGIALIIFGTVASVRFEQNCKGYLKRAADANTIALAEQELGKAVGYLEANGLTEGDTSVWYTTPKCDLGYWYSNLRASLDELSSMPADADQLTVSSHLLKLRETIMDHGEKGTRVTIPPNTFVYPNQIPYRLAGGATVTLLLVGLMSVAVQSDMGCQSSPSDSE